MLENERVAENVESVRRRIENACLLAGRCDLPVLMAATKTVPAEQINFVVEHCGVTDIGENRVQELLEKYPALSKNVRLHFIGRLQKNKVKYIVDKVCLIHSADSLPLLEEIEKQAGRIGKRMDVLLEINTGSEPQKGGFLPDEIDGVLEKISAFEHVHVKGLMAVTPVCEKKEDFLVYFKETFQKFVDISEKRIHNVDMDVLSMGMTDSFEEAIACGSTMVRIGSAIFGRRSAQQEEGKNGDPAV